MPAKKYYSPQEAIDYLNEKFHPSPLLNPARLARLRREKRIHGEKIGDTNTSVYTRKALDMVTLVDLEDKRKNSCQNLLTSHDIGSILLSVRGTNEVPPKI